MKLPKLIASSLRNKLIALMLIAAIPAFAIAISVVSGNAAKRLEDWSKEGLEQAATMLVIQVSRWDAQTTTALRNLSLQPDIVSMKVSDQKPVLEKMASTYAELYLIHTTDLKGMNVARSDGNPLQSYKDRSYIQEALDGKDISYDLVISKTIKIPALSVACPIRDPNSNHVVGAVAALASLGVLGQEVGAVKLGKTGYAFVVNENGKVLAHPDKNISYSLTDLSQYPPVKAALAKQAGFLEYHNQTTGDILWSYSKTLANGWVVVAVQSSSEVLTDVRNFQILASVLGLAATIILIVAVGIVGNRIVAPIIELKEGTEIVAKGDYSRRIQTDMTDEVGQLANAFNSMAGNLEKSIKELQETTAAKERIESEIKIAKQIQTGLLPTIFPAFPERDEFDLFACMEPAREVGGDFYDFYLLNDNCLSFVVGDVSDKGIPAALFMAVTKTLLKASSGNVLPPHEILNRVNRDLCRENDACNFVTMFYAMLDLETGTINYCNAGHNPPFLVRKNGHAEICTVSAGIPVGVVDDYVYKTDTLKLDVGDTILLYTDGVTEARSKTGDFFGDDALLKSFDELKNAPSKEICTSVLDRVRDFATGYIQSDDITLLSLRYNGKKNA